MWQTDGIIPADIVIDILSRMRAKDVIRFRCVSRSWKALIYSSYFIDLHHNRSIQTYSNEYSFMSHTGFYCYQFIDSDNIHKRVLCNMNFIPNSYIVKGFASGMYLLRKNGRKDGKNAIYNISTHECKELPCLPIYIKFYHGHWCGGFGFYYDSANEDFKVLLIFWDNDNNVQTIIYSLRRNSWCRIESGTFRISSLQDYRGVFVSGALHWLHGREKKIVAFDIGTEKYRIVPLPNCPSSEISYNRCIGELADCLYITYCNIDTKINYLWMMKNYGEWTKLLSLPLPNILVLKPLCFSKKHDEILFFNEEGREGLFSYDMKKQTIEGIHEDAVQVTTRDGALIENLVQLSNYGKKKRNLKKKLKRQLLNNARV